ncbi:N-acetylmuramoyl-L-alanine amidase [Candidatus Paracaedimonas acanthamoebae]|nr:N-acetylmuramoyl-L-alanine amidase [Candidatus Paracaedimonas acanthamoebae]
MKKRFLLLSLLSLAGVKSVGATAIESIFPEAFKPRITIQEKDIYGVQGYQVQEFIGSEVNRNHWDSRGDQTIQSLVMHYTVCDYPTTMRLFTANIPDGRVSAHYVITEKEEVNAVKGGVVTQLVPEEKRAWHAGASYWRGIQNLNASSIGVENVNKGFIESGGKRQWFAFDPDQIATLGQLSAGIVEKYNISPENVVGHADIVPDKKSDPGILFPWEELYTQYGVGAWLTEKERSNPTFISEGYLPKEPLPQGISEAFFLNALRAYGYQCPESAYITPAHEPVIKAFKAHFSHNQKPDHYTATLDKTAMVWAWGLSAKYPQEEK